MSFITFLAQGPKGPLLQDLQFDKQLSHVSITYGKDHRAIEQIKQDAGRKAFFCFSRHTISARNDDFIISIDYSCIDRAEQIWRDFHRYTLYTLSGTAAVLAGLVTLSLSRVITARPIVLAQFAVACFFMFVLFRTEDIYNHKPPFLESYTGYTDQITQFRRTVIENGQENLEKAKTLLPSALQERATEFFTENEKNLLGIV